MDFFGWVDFERGTSKWVDFVNNRIDFEVMVSSVVALR